MKIKAKFKLAHQHAKILKSSKSKRTFKHSKKACVASTLIVLRDNAKLEKEDDYSINRLLQLLPSTDNNKDNRLPEWEYIGKQKLCIYQLAMRNIEEQEKLTDKPANKKLKLVPFVLNISDKAQNRIKGTKRSEAAECNDLLRKALKNDLGRGVDFWFHIEMAPNAGYGKYHIQGSMLISDHELEKAKKGLKKINGKADADWNRYELRFRYDERQKVAKKHGLLFSDINWADYCSKEHSQVKILYTDQERKKLLKPYAASRALNSQAKKLYCQLRLAQTKQSQKAA